MNILIINSSPHTKGTTALLRDKFAEWASAAGHNITTFHACKEELHPCIGCDHCRTGEEGCIYKDGMEKLNPLLLSADRVVFVTPLYYFGMSAQIKTAIDRFYANNALLRSQPKKAILLAACGDTDSWAMDALYQHYQAVCRYLHWEDAGSVLAIGMYTRPDIESSDYPDAAKTLGQSLV